MNNLFILCLMISIVIVGSIEYITMPIFSVIFTSIYFVSLIISLESLAMFGLIYLVVLIKNNSFHNAYPDHLLLLVTIGLANGFLNLCLLYASNPIRTPVLIQSILLGLMIFPSVLFTKIILNKNVQYILHIVCASMIFLIASIFCAVIPTVKGETFNSNNVFWILVYFLGVVLISFTNILQEKYTIITENTFESKTKMMFYSGIFQLLAVILLFWLDFLFGYSDSVKFAFGNFTESWETFTSEPLQFWSIQIFTVNNTILVILSVYLNSISTNYNMLLTNLINQSVALFFTIFPQWNTGIKTSPVFVVVSLLFNAVSVFLWVKGETH